MIYKYIFRSTRFNEILSHLFIKASHSYNTGINIPFKRIIKAVILFVLKNIVGLKKQAILAKL